MLLDFIKNRQSNSQEFDAPRAGTFREFRVPRSPERRRAGVSAVRPWRWRPVRSRSAGSPLPPRRRPGPGARNPATGIGCGWNRRSLRTRSVETRLAVRLATQPLGNCSRTLAISTLSERMEMPAARISCGSAPASARTISTSWIIRSSTTSTSRLRGLNRFRRWISKNSGRVARRSSSTHRGVEALQVAHLEDAAVPRAAARSGGRRRPDRWRWAFPPARRCRPPAARSRLLHGPWWGRRRWRRPPCRRARARSVNAPVW